MRIAIPAPVRFVTREEANDLAAPLLRNHPFLRKFRATDIFAWKILDVSMIEQGARICYCDSDVFFFRPFTGLFEFADDDVAILMHDRFHAYAFSRNMDVRYYFPLPRKANAGLINFPKAAMDFDYLEFLLRKNILAPGWTEQTMWALLANRIEARWPERVTIPLPGEEPEDAIAWHLTSRVRSNWSVAELQATLALHVQAPATAVRLHPFGELSYWRYLAHHYRHALQWRTGKIKDAIQAAGSRRSA